MQYLIIPDTSQHYNKNLLGGKAFNLIEMQKAQLPVPAFAIIPSTVVALILAPIQNDIDNLILNIDKKTPQSLANTAKAIQAKILALDIPIEIQNEVNSLFQHPFSPNTYVAVRSSATAEDGQNASFAGQHATFLSVNQEDIFDKIKHCIASAWNVGALTYRLQKGIKIQNIQYAIAIQKMVAAKKSGVGFSMHLQGNLADAVLVAGFGLGEGIVSDQVETDTFIINRQSQNISKKIAAKKEQLIFHSQKGIINTAVPTPLQNETTLTDEEIQRVFKLMIKTESLLSCPADVEFSFDENGNLFLLQMRPITAIDFDSIKILDNTNIVESYPEVTLPLSFSFALKAYEKVFTGSSKAFWVSQKVIQRDAKIFKNLLAHYCGRVYYRLDNWYRMMGLVYSSPRSMAAWEKAVGLTNSEKEKVKFSFQNQLKTILSIIWLIINYKRGNRRFFKIFKKNYAFLKNIQPHENQPKALWQHYEAASARLFKPWYLTLVNDFLAFKAFGWLQDFIQKNQLGKEELANDLLCGMGGVESEEAVLNVLFLKSEIKKSKPLTELFSESEEYILEQLQQEKYADFYKKIKHHTDTYGDRTLAELKLEAPSLRRNPILFIRLLKNQLSSPVNIEDFRAQQKRIRTHAEAQINSQLKWWQPKTYVFRFIRNLAAYGLKNRENMRFCRTRGYGAIKDIFLEMANMMVEAQAIEAIQDVFYLETKDLEAFANDKHSNFREKIKHEKTKYQGYASLQLPDRVIYTGEQPPINLEQNREKYSDSARCKA